jgi:hypothetical protein
VTADAHTGLDEGWPQAAAAAAAAAVGADLGDADLAGTVEIVVPPTAGRPRRSLRADAAAPADLRLCIDVEAGRVQGWRAGPADDVPLVTFTIPAPDARAALEEGTDPSVLFMQGRLKVDGDLGAALAVLAATARPGFGAAAAALRG